MQAGAAELSYLGQQVPYEIFCIQVLDHYCSGIAEFALAGGRHGLDCLFRLHSQRHSNAWACLSLKATTQVKQQFNNRDGWDQHNFNDLHIMCFNFKRVYTVSLAQQEDFNGRIFLMHSNVLPPHSGANTMRMQPGTRIKAEACQRGNQTTSAEALRAAVESAFREAQSMDTLVELPEEFKTLANARPGPEHNPFLYSRYYKIKPLASPPEFCEPDPVACIRFPAAYATSNSIAKLYKWSTRKDVGISEAWAGKDSDHSLCIIIRKTGCKGDGILTVLRDAYERTLRKFGASGASPPEICRLLEENVNPFVMNLNAKPLAELIEQPQNPLLYAIAGIPATRAQIEETIAHLQARIEQQKRPQKSDVTVGSHAWGYWEEDGHWHKCIVLKTRTKYIKVSWNLDGTASCLSADSVLPRKRKRDCEAS